MVETFAPQSGLRLGPPVVDGRRDDRRLCAGRPCDSMPSNLEMPASPVARNGSRADSPRGLADECLLTALAASKHAGCFVWSELQVGQREAAATLNGRRTPYPKGCSTGLAFPVCRFSCSVRVPSMRGFVLGQAAGRDFGPHHLAQAVRIVRAFAFLRTRHAFAGGQKLAGVLLPVVQRLGPLAVGQFVIGHDGGRFAIVAARVLAGPAQFETWSRLRVASPKLCG